MGRRTSDPDEATGDMAADDRTPPGQHPDPETLLAYHERTLSEAEADRVQEHLVGCPECAQTVLDFAAFPDLEPPSEEHRLSPAEMARRWRDLEARIAEERLPWWRRSGVLLPLAAVFLVASVGLAVWGALLQNRIAELEGPRGDVFVIGLAPGSGQLRSGGDAHGVPPWGRQIQLLLAYPGVVEEGAAHEVDVIAARGRRVVSGEPVWRSRDGQFAVTVPRAALPPGAYTVELHQRADGVRRTIATYKLTLAGEGR